MASLSPSGKLVTVFGGSGFIGRHVVGALAKRGYRIRVAVRRPDLAGHLQPLGAVGQIHAIQANLRYRWSVDRAVERADAVINLVGLLTNAGPQTFDAVQAFGARAIAEAARGAGIETAVHLSAIGADPNSDIDYARTKADGEAAIAEVLPDAIIIRPSIVFGPEDGFFNKFASMARFSPVLPLIGGGTTLFQPVYVGDIAEAVARAIDNDLAPGAVYEMGGPDVVSFKQCLVMIMEMTGRQRMLAPIPYPAAEFIGRIAGLAPRPPLTRDQVRLLKRDNVVSDTAKAEGRTLSGIGITSRSLESILPAYMGRYRAYGQFAKIRES